MADCVFCKIVAGEIKTNFEYEGENVVVFPDISPKAPTHLLIVPKKHVPHFVRMAKEDESLWQEMHEVAKELIAKHDLTNKGYRLVTNGGTAALVPHLHMHLLGGVTAHREV